MDKELTESALLADRATQGVAPGTREIPIAVVAAWSAIDADIRVLIGIRPPGVHLAGSAELPGGKVEPGESTAAAARREFREETGWAAGFLEPLATVRHAYPERTVTITAFTTRLDVSDWNAPTARHRWVRRAELAGLPWPDANGPITAALEERLAGR